MASNAPDASQATPPPLADQTPAAQGGRSPTVPFEEEFNEFPNEISAWNSVLMYINHKILPGFANHHIARVGRSVAPGLRVEVQTAWGPRIPSTLIIRLQVRNGDDIQDFAILTLPMGQTEKPMDADSFRPSERPEVRHIFPKQPGDPVGVSYSRYRHHDLDYFKGIPSNEPTWVLVFRTTWEAVRLETVIDVHKIAVSYPAKFWDRIGSQPAGLRSIVEKLRSTFDGKKPSEQVSIQFVFPYARGWERDWYVFLTDKRKINPGVLDLQALCDHRIEKLDYSNALIGQQWLDEELAWKQKMAWNCGKTYFKARLLPFPGSEWIPTTSDMAEYGMNGTRGPMAYLLVVNLSYVREFLPDIGTKSKVYIRELAQQGYTLPRPLVAEADVKVLATRLQRTLGNAEDWAKKKFWNRGRTQWNADEVKELFIQSAAVDVAMFLPMPSADDRRNAAASQAATFLRKRENEDDDDHYRRIFDWIREALCVAPKTRYHEPYTGIRLSLPPGVSADVGLFFLEVPRQQDWPRGLKKPPMVVEAPEMSPVTDLQGVLDTAFADPRDVLRTEIRYSVEENWELKGDEAIPIMNNVDFNAEETAWWKFMMKGTKVAQGPTKPKH
ncbi:hypothetical protein BBK36DRAFT_1143473 [Trichoderma citrinoviride]|uniref:Uncharacterized protein n=1 Tax=Trichoderma citrinoviride TaxID=58853 RepID=A0A2T4B376_9HYPO|nr:hypothetical protein BBK36DRAFT_1143473 [Trichoderma citrinoviride]PTB63764.1 hypothetical protein BBK36DRAFT_1143473 [Trichoderma citrinoviride]